MLKKRAKARSEDSVSSVASSLVNIHKDRVVRQFERDIRQFIELRNTIIHQPTNRAIAEPYEETVVSLRKLVVNIEQPKTAWDIATTELIRVSLEDSLSQVDHLCLILMKRRAKTSFRWKTFGDLCS